KTTPRVGGSWEARLSGFRLPKSKKTSEVGALTSEVFLDFGSLVFGHRLPKSKKTSEVCSCITKPRARWESELKPFRYIRGRYMLLSLPRRYVCDLIHFAKRVPTVATQRRMRLSKVIAARAEWPVHCSWYAIFIKAYALVCAARPELRRTYQ